MNLILRNIGRFILLLLLQLVVFNNVYLGGYITPFLYVLFILMLPNTTPKVVMLLLSFAAGLCVDVFSNVLGFHAFCATLVALCRITFANKILTRGEETAIPTPSIRSVALAPLLYYLFILLFIYNTAYYILVHFSFHDLPRILLSALLNSVVTWVLAIIYQSLLLRKDYQ